MQGTESFVGPQNSALRQSLSLIIQWWGKGDSSHTLPWPPKDDSG